MGLLTGLNEMCVKYSTYHKHRAYTELNIINIGC